MGAENYMKVSIMFISALLLTQMVFWMAKNSKSMKGNMENKMEEYITTGNIVGMVIHSFLVVLREGVETVFFFAAITGGNIGAAVEGWGAITGMIIATVVSFLFFKGTMSVSLTTFFKVTGAFIILIAAGLMIQGISLLQDINVIGSVIPHVYDLTWLLPEHPLDYEHYLRDTGNAPLISGQVGLFLKALFGYASMPSLEEILAYLGYFVVVYLLVKKSMEPSEVAANSQVAASRNN
jgi:high-affinity iron transporter